MRIIFLCGSTEPGADGVGDYTLRLVGELIKLGHSGSIIAICDPFILDNVECIQISNGISVNVLRLSFQLSSKDRFSSAKDYINKYNPEWISLQFVIFAFQKKGLPLNLSKQLEFLGIERKWHIMFHELWVGMEMGSSVKHLLWGKLQRRIIKNIVMSLKPSKIHTQPRLYQLQLARLNFTSEYLPLFSNIKKISGSDRADTLSFVQEKKDHSLIVFGTIHPNAPVNKLADEISQYCNKKKIKLVVKFIGRTGYEQNNWSAVMTAANIPIEVLGEQSPEVISEILSSGTLGISTTSLSHIEKSGTVAAMLEHKLTVLCVSKINEFKTITNFYIPEGIVEYKPGNFETCISKNLKFQYKNTVSEIALQFTNSLLNVK